ncbi:MAG: NADH-quinone oxidoreductase subunit C, partial [Planctomycetota bacterium]|nr:NADH-quinone oxidoreductase subunit C [Planctomycetota bacterium]
MSPARTLPLHNGEVAGIDEVPVLAAPEFRAAVIEAVRGGARLAALFGRPARDGVSLVAVLARDDAGLVSILAADVGGSYASLTPDCMQAHWFEREIAEQWGVRPEGHPWLKPIRFEPASGTGRDVWNRRGRIVVGETDFFRIEGEEIHEVAVGPVHAGVIEPGHFRFQCHGENVYHLEISLGYQHRGVERALVGGPTPRTIHYMETLAGDTTVGHGTAYSRAIESLGGAKSPARAQAIRGIGLELERIANHVGDLGALAGDVGGGAGYDLDDQLIATLRERLDEAARDAAVAINLLWETPSVTARFEDTGTLTRETCEAIGLVGPAARACGVERDVRHDFPFGMFRFTHIPVSTWHTGDVFARAYVRWIEVQRSFAFIREQLDSLPGGGILGEPGDLEADSIVVSLVEGWRGE